jgi:hypothetical protein
MKLAIDVLAGVAACGGAYYLALPYFTEDEVTTVVRSNPGVPKVNQERLPVPEAPAPNRAAITAPRLRAGERMDAGLSMEQQSSMNMLRNGVIHATAEDMHRRGEDVMTCLDGVRLAGAEKIRFSVDVVSTPNEATTGRWRFVEIADGEPLPASFASCAARAMGGGQHFVPPKDFHFPEYQGDLLILYTIPAPSAD